MHSIYFQPKNHDIMYDVVLVDRVVTGRADKGHTKPILFIAHNPFHRAVTWISSASFNPRLGSHFKWFLGLYKQNDVRKSLCQMGTKVIKTKHFRVLNIFNESQGYKQLIRFSISFSQSFQNNTTISCSVCTEEQQQMHHHPAPCYRAGTAKSSCLLLNSILRPWEEGEQCRLERKLCWTGHIPLQQGPTRQQPGGKVRGETWDGGTNVAFKL